MLDKFGRRLKYLRISVTDRCNFRCRYCMPQNNFSNIEHNNILSYEDILYLSEVFAKLGVNRLRVTGGEPLVRKGIIEFLSKLTKINGISEVMLTTNGALLGEYATALITAGIKRLNISLDTLKKDRFELICGRDMFDQTLAGIRASVKAGFTNTKVNAVIIRDFNDDELDDFVKFAADENILIRFIEFMPIGNSDLWSKDNIVTGREILEKLAKYEPVKIVKDINSGPAVNYKLNNSATIGVITPISKHFCDECDKLRLTSDGNIRSCLLSDNELSVKEAVKNKDEKKIIELIVEAMNIKAKEHDVDCKDKTDAYKRTMSKIGG